MKEFLSALIGFGGGLVFFVGPWVYHIVWCVRYAAESGSAIALLIIGVVLPPVGWVHGVSLLFGATWI